MTFIQSLITELEGLWSECNLYFETPAGATKPYIVMNIVAPGEQPDVFCEDQGDAGDVLLQFSGAASSSQATYNLLERFKNVVQAISGTVTHGTPSYRITQNVTDGVRGFDAGLNTWQAIFEARFRWAVSA